MVSTPRRSSSRLGVLCLALAYLLLQLGGAWHLSRQAHARCAAHGEWIDVAHASVDAQPHLATSTADASRTPRGPVAHSTGAGQNHDHCMIVEAARVRAVVCDGAPAELGHELVVSVAPRPAAEPVDLGFDLYLLAPKQSPPC